MNSVGALKSVIGVVGSNIVNSAKDATKHVVDKIKGKTINKAKRIHSKKRKAGNEKREVGEVSENVNDKGNLINLEFDKDKSINSDSSFDHSDNDESNYSSENDSILDFRDRVVSEQEYNKLTELLSRDIKMTNRGNSEMEKQIWLTPRRFRTTIRSVQIENLTKVQQNNVFLEFSFGGTLTEIRLLDGKKNKEVPRLLGYPPCKEFYTHSVDIKPFLLQEGDDLLIDIPNNVCADNDTDDSCVYDGMRSSNSVDISVDETFEWRGSYLHLERELFRIIAWRSKISTVNEMLGYSEDVLKNYATGSVNQMITLSKRTNNNISIPMFRISLQIIFQEIYDFQLNLTQFTLRNSNDKKNNEMEELSNDYEFGNEINYNKDESLPLNSNTGNTVKIDLTDKSESESLIPLKDKSSYRLNIKFPQYGHDSPFPTKCTSDWSCNDSEKDKVVRWDNIGVVPFRGTIHELEKNNLYVTLDINNNSSMNVFGVKKHIQCKFNLKNVVYYPYIQTDIKLPDGETCKLEGKMEFGSIPKYHQLGNILEIDDENKLYMIIKIIKIDNLISNVYEISNILQESDDSIDVFVQLTFDGTRKETPIVSGSIHPLFHTEITFVIENIGVDKLDKEFDEDKLIKLLERKGPITIDVWRKNSKTSMISHIGWSEIHWRDILIRTNNGRNNMLFSPKNDLSSIGLSPIKVDVNMTINNSSSNNNNSNSGSSGNANLTHHIRRREYRKFYDRNIGKEIIYETRVYQNGNVLYNLGDRPGLLSNNSNMGNNERNSLNLLVSPRIYLEIWTKPDIMGLYNVKFIGNENKEVTKNFLNKLNKIIEWSGIGPSLRQTRIRSNVYYWENITKSFETWGRRYSYFGIDPRGIRHLLPTFIQPLKPLVGVDNSSKVHHFVHSFPYSPTKTNSNTSNYMKWTTPDIFLLSRQGTPLDHTLLQVCLLLGLNKVAFLACGTLLNRDPYSWAVTFHYEYIYNKNENDLEMEFELNNRNMKGFFNKNMNNSIHIKHTINDKRQNNNKVLTRGRNRSRNEDIYGRNKMKSLSPKSSKGNSNYRNRSHDHLGNVVMDYDNNGGILIGGNKGNIEIGGKNVNIEKRSKELISSLSPIKIRNKIENEKKSRKIRFYALFWDTVKHIVYRVNNIISESKNEEFMNWLKYQGYDMNQLEESAMESYYVQKSNDKKMNGNYNINSNGLKNMNYKPNFCLKVVSKLPYRTIDMLVNNKNIYANIQQVHDPMKVSYDLSDNNIWFTFFHRDDVGNDNIKSVISKSINSNVNEKNGLIGDQLPIKERNSYILPCFTWPIINVVTQQNYKNAVTQNKVGLGVKSVLSPIFNKNMTNKKGKISNNQNRDENIKITRDNKSKDIEKNKNRNNANELDEEDNIKCMLNESDLLLLGGYGDILDNEIDMYCRSINEEIVRYIQVQRFQKSRTIGTRWNNENDNMGFLRIGLKLLGKWEMSDPYTMEYYNNKSEFLKWRESFLSTIPKKYKLKYAILTFPYNIPRWLAQQVWFKCHFLSDETDRRSIFSLSVDVNSWPNNVKTIRVLILVIHPLKSSQLRKLKLIQKLNNININDVSSSVIKNSKNKLVDKYHNEKNIGIDSNTSNLGSCNNNNNKVSNNNSNIKNNHDSENDSLIYDDYKLLPPFPKDLLKDEINNSVSTNKKRASSILFSDEEPELKLIQP